MCVGLEGLGTLTLEKQCSQPLVLAILDGLFFRFFSLKLECCETSNTIMVPGWGAGLFEGEPEIRPARGNRLQLGWG